MKRTVVRELRELQMKSSSARLAMIGRNRRRDTEMNQSHTVTRSRQAIHAFKIPGFLPFLIVQS